MNSGQHSLNYTSKTCNLVEEFHIDFLNDDIHRAMERFERRVEDVLLLDSIEAYSVFELLLILLLRDNICSSAELINVMKRLAMSINTTCCLNAQRWEAEYYYMIGDIRRVKEILLRLRDSDIDKMDEATYEGIVNLAHRAMIANESITIPWKRYPSIKKHDDLAVKIKFNDAVNKYQMQQYELAKTQFSWVCNNTKNSLIRGYCHVYLSRMEKDINKKLIVLDEAAACFSAAGSERMKNYIGEQICTLKEMTNAKNG